MSTCISTHGEYSEHTPASEDPMTCAYCGDFDEAIARQAVRERDELRRWKTEAMEVMSGLQEVGHALGIPLGGQITGRAAVDAAMDLRNERDELRGVVERVRGELRGPHPMPRDRRSQDHYPSLIERLLALLPDTPNDERSNA